jgi:hypothetical protein
MIADRSAQPKADLLLFLFPAKSSQGDFDTQMVGLGIEPARILNRKPWLLLPNPNGFELLEIYRFLMQRWASRNW